MIWKTFLEVRREPLTSVSPDVAVKMPDEVRVSFDFNVAYSSR